MNFAYALKWGERQLKKSASTTPRLDSLVLLEDASKIDRAKILAYDDKEVAPNIINRYKQMIQNRSSQLPLAYIRGVSEFYGRSFIINENVLVPRPESEQLIEELLKLKKADTIIDIGTGSGALAVSAKLELPSSRVIATDVNSKCLILACKNAVKLGAKVELYRGSLLAAVPEDAWGAHTVIIANLPYIPANTRLNLSAKQEPSSAIFGGPDGLDYYRKLFIELTSLKVLAETVICESEINQQESLAEIALEAGYTLTDITDMVSVFSTV